MIAANVIKALDGRPVRFLTLTLRQSSAGLRDAMNRITDCFRRLRARKFWKAHVTGGAGFLEFKRSKTRQAWNVHVHCLVHGRYLDQYELSREWYRVTTDSLITDVRFVRDEGRIVSYVTKYVSKPWDRGILQDERKLDEVTRAVAGKRLVITFGTWRGLPLTQSPDPRDWSVLGTIADVAYAAIQGDHEAVLALIAIFGLEVEAVLTEAKRRPRERPKQRAPPLSQCTFSWHVPVNGPVALGI